MFLPFSPIELVEQICVCSTHQKSYFCINLQVSPRPGKCNILKSKTYTRLYVVKTIQIQSCMQKRKKKMTLTVDTVNQWYWHLQCDCRRYWVKHLQNNVKLQRFHCQVHCSRCYKRSCGIIFSEHLNMHFVCSFRHVSRKQTKIEFSPAINMNSNKHLQTLLLVIPLFLLLIHVFRPKPTNLHRWFQHLFKLKLLRQLCRHGCRDDRKLNFQFCNKMFAQNCPMIMFVQAVTNLKNQCHPIYPSPKLRIVQFWPCHYGKYTIYMFKYRI